MVGLSVTDPLERSVLMSNHPMRQQDPTLARMLSKNSSNMAPSKDIVTYTWTTDWHKIKSGATYSPPTNTGGMSFFEDGGRPQVGKPFVMNEAGPEPMVRDASGALRIIPDHDPTGIGTDAPGAGGGAGLSIASLTINIEGTMDLTSPEGAREAAMAIRSAIIDLESETS